MFGVSACARCASVGCARVERTRFPRPSARTPRLLSAGQTAGQRAPPRPLGSLGSDTPGGGGPGVCACVGGRQIRKGEFTFPSPYWDEVSEGAKDLVSRMLVVDPTKRFTAHQARTPPPNAFESRTKRFTAHQARAPPHPNFHHAQALHRPPGAHTPPPPP